MRISLPGICEREAWDQTCLLASASIEDWK